MTDIKIFVADDVSEGGLEPLRAAGFVVEKRTGLKGDGLAEAVAGADGLVVRSETKVTAALLESAARLRVIGRAGVGVDNIDVAAATGRGVVVMNAPDGNTMTTAEHTLALLLALARRVPQGQASLKAGRWERKKFVGVELRGKTLGIVGLGRIGRVVASRALGFEMKVVAFDPFVAPERLRDEGIELAPLEEVCARADFLTVHAPLTPETRGIIGAREFALMKGGVRVINCARGGLVDERALYDAIREGRVAGAALDVFEQEPPPPDHPLLSLEEVVVTPHLGASTKEAQEGVAVIVAEQMRDFFLTGAVRGAVNTPSVGAQELKALEPYINLAERLGNMSARVNVVNSMLIAEERGISVKVSQRHGGGGEPREPLHTRVVTAAGGREVAGALFWRDSGGRVTEIDGFRIEAVPAGNMILTRNSDVPGVVGRVGTILGERGVNISRFHL